MNFEIDEKMLVQIPLKRLSTHPDLSKKPSGENNFYIIVPELEVLCQKIASLGGGSFDDEFIKRQDGISHLIYFHNGNDVNQDTEESNKLYKNPHYHSKEKWENAKVRKMMDNIPISSLYLLVLKRIAFGRFARLTSKEYVEWRIQVNMSKIK